MKALSNLVMLGFAGIALLGFAYFGPPELTSFMTDNTTFRTKIAPAIDKLLALGGSDESTVGYLTQVRSQVDYRPPSALAPIQARGGERLSQGTVVSSGPRSASLIRLVDDSVIRLDENTTLQIELPVVTGSVASIELKVLEGSVLAQKAKESTANVKIRNILGVVSSVGQSRIILGARAKDIKTLSGSDSAMDLASIERAAQREIEEARLKAEAEKKRAEEIAAREKQLKEEQERLAKQAQEREEARRKAELLAKQRSQLEAKIAAGKRKLSRGIAGSADLAIGLYEKKYGNKKAAQRYMAKALTNRGYSGNDFNDATKIAFDQLMQGYIEESDCIGGLEFLKNISQNYKDDPRAQRWSDVWKKRFYNSQCN